MHGVICEENGFIGTAFKTAQLGRFDNPTALASTQVQVGEPFEIQLGGVHEAVRTGNLAAADVGTDIYIQVSNNTLCVAAQALATAGAGPALNAGFKKVGKVTARDVTRTPQVLRINANFLELVRGNDV